MESNINTKIAENSEIIIEEDNDEVTKYIRSWDQVENNETNCTSSEEEGEDINKLSFSFAEKLSHSPHDKSYTGIEIINANQLSPYDLVKFMNRKDIAKYVLRCLPWHITGTISFIVDSNGLKDRNDIGTDAWRWSCTSTKTYSTDDLDCETKYKEMNDGTQHRVIKRYYSNTSDAKTKRHILAVYPPSVECKGTQPFKNCQGNVFIGYFSAENVVIPPAKKTKTYASTKAIVADKVQRGIKTKKAVFETDMELGGLENMDNQSSIPRRSYGYEVARSKNKLLQEEDPLKKLLTKQKEEARTDNAIIRKIIFDGDSYTVVLFSDTCINNIANYCCTENNEYLSPLSFDFTFELVRNPPLFALVCTYKNTSLYKKGINKCPVMLGPVMLCHRRTEEAVRSLFDALFEKCPGLQEYIRVVGMDGEKSLVNVTCHSLKDFIRCET